MKKVITRFAPSPTGKLHIGNLRVAIINWLYARKHRGEFLLRMDDTDTKRIKDEYKKEIFENLKWLGISWEKYFNQLSRLEKYDTIRAVLISEGILYPCYETPEELEFKRKFQLSKGKPPIYDRASLKLTKKQIYEYEKQGRKPHYRFLIKNSEIKWHDLIKGEIKYNGVNLCDPVIIREDGTMTYMLSSTIDDIEYNVSHVIRGEDHISNTAIQIQMFEALGATPPCFAHLGLIKAKDSKISKRYGGFDISSLKCDNIEPMAINSFLSLIGSSDPIVFHKTIQDLVDNFDIQKYSRGPTIYNPRDLDLLNHKLIISYEYNEIQKYLEENDLLKIDKDFWYAVRPNLHKLSDLALWWKICNDSPAVDVRDTELMKIAYNNLPREITDESWKYWTDIISNKTGKKGKELFMPLRLAITGRTDGPELKNLLPIIKREKILERLEMQIKKRGNSL